MIPTYSPEDIQIIIGGVWKLEGLSNGSFLSISKDIPVMTTTRSSDGQIHRSIRRDDGYTIGITLVQTSQSNSFLTKLLAADRATHQGKFPLFIKDNNGSTVFAAGSCWIMNEPSVTFADGIESRQWTIQCTQGGLYTGDNFEDTSIIDDAISLATAFAPHLRDYL